eukprot:TRINITY_DN39308_c0_g1_i1.p1 TRINITY_DN39308_c0_g1~~TRINITY_DN39308_c0_g1_i1.p1  ORF type:complete len:261 (-),score=44.16 TRINITY_DN39308_c0_g1_i1:94-798(-)
MSPFLSGYRSWNFRKRQVRPVGLMRLLLAVFLCIQIFHAQLFSVKLHAFLVVSTTESETGVVFPDELEKQTLVATGVRKKYGAVKVYAIALYVDKGSKIWKSKSKPSADDLIKEVVSKSSLQLTITSGLVTQEKLANALQESIQPRLKDLDEGEKVKVIDEFRNVFVGGPKLQKGQFILFKLVKEGLLVQIGENYKAQVKSPALSRALLATYVDDQAVSPKFREAIFNRFLDRS